jgi:hypothetical protein
MTKQISILLALVVSHHQERREESHLKETKLFFIIS